MIAVGIDYSSHAVDVVVLDEHIVHTTHKPWTPTTAVTHHRVEFAGKTSWDRLWDARVKSHLIQSLFSIDPDIIIIEEPAGYRTGQLKAFQGAITMFLPIQPTAIYPAEWKKQTVGRGDASKDEVREWARECLGHWDTDWPQDAYDAYAMSVYGRQLLEPKRKAA